MSKKITQFKVSKVPDHFEWEVHSLHAYADKKKAFGEGRITEVELRQFEHDLRETEEQREFRWNQQNVMMELEKENAQNYREFKDKIKNINEKNVRYG